MTDRSDIAPITTRDGGRWRPLSYTRHAGWIDWGHALPDGARSLKRQLDAEASGFALLDRVPVRLEGREAFVVSYGQQMGSGPIVVSATRHWIVPKGLAAHARAEVALAIFCRASLDFEGLQASRPYSLLTRSGFSQEDLVSNIVGFYGVYRNMAQDRLRRICGEVSVAESFRVWDEHVVPAGGRGGLGALKNRTFRPVYYPTREGSGVPTFPAQFRTIAPAPEGVHWVRPQGRFLDGRLVNAGAPLDFDRRGRVSVGPRAY